MSISDDGCLSTNSISRYNSPSCPVALCTTSSHAVVVGRTSEWSAQCVVAAMTSPVTSPDGHSPSSDKENNAKVTPDAAAAAADDASPKKWTPPKVGSSSSPGDAKSTQTSVFCRFLRLVSSRGRKVNL